MKKISELAAATASAEADLAVIVQGGVSKKATLDVLRTEDMYDDWRWGAQIRSDGPTSARAVFTQIGTRNAWAYLFTNGDNAYSSDNQIPHDYKEGTDIQPHVHFSPSTTGTYTGTWTMHFSGWLTAGNGEPIESELTFTAAFNQAMTQHSGYSFNFDGVISGLGRKISSMCCTHLNLALTSGAGLFLIGWDGHYRKDRIGSRNITSK